MRFIGAISIVLLILASCYERREHANTEPFPIIVEPRLYFVEPVIELGRITARPDPHVARFALRNATEQTVRVKEIQKSCTCFGVTTTRNTIPPKGELEIDVVVAVDTPGKSTASISVVFDERLRDTLTATLRLEVIGAYTSSVPSLDLGPILVESEPHVQLNLKRECQDCSLTEITAIGDGLQVDSIVENSDHALVGVTVKASKDQGDRHGMLQIRVSGAWPESVVIPVNWTIREEVAVTPRKLSLGSGKPGDILTATAELNDHTNRRCQILEIQTTCDAGTLSVSTRELPSGGIRLNVTLPVEVSNQIVLGNIRIQLSAPLSKIVEIPISAYFNGPDSKEDSP